jgi:hypothetical protein
LGTSDPEAELAELLVCAVLAHRDRRGVDAGFAAHTRPHSSQAVLVVVDHQRLQRQFCRRVESRVIEHRAGHFLRGRLSASVLRRLKRILVIAGIYWRAILDAGRLQELFGQLLSPIDVFLERQLALDRILKSSLEELDIPVLRIVFENHMSKGVSRVHFICKGCSFLLCQIGSLLDKPEHFGAGQHRLAGNLVHRILRVELWSVVRVGKRVEFWRAPGWRCLL